MCVCGRRLDGCAVVGLQQKDGHTFRGGVAFCDNEVVLNSSAVRELCLKYGITLRNSCPYEPWQNGACERANATCGRIVREMMARAGGHGATQLYQYWGYAWVYARNKILLHNTPD